MFTSKSSSATKEQKVIQAEILFSNFIVEHNLPIAIADHASELLKQCFRSVV